MSTFIFLLSFVFAISACVPKKASLESATKSAGGGDCKVRSETAQFGSLLFAGENWMFKVSRPAWANQISSQLGKEVARCDSFLVTQFQEMEDDVKRFVDSAATKIPIAELNKLGFGVVQAVYNGFEKNLKSSLFDPNDSIAMQKSLGVVHGHLEGGQNFVAYAALESMLQADEELEWHIVISPPLSAFEAVETQPDGTKVKRSYEVKHWTCGDPSCRLVDIPGIFDSCPSCAQPRLFGQDFYDAVYQATKIDLNDYGSLAAAMGGKDVGCSNPLCNASNPGNSVRDNQLTCRACSYVGEPILDKDEGRRRIKDLARSGQTWQGVLRVPKSGGKAELSGFDFDRNSADPAKVDVSELISRTSGDNHGLLNFYGDNESNIQDSISRQSTAPAGVSRWKNALEGKWVKVAAAAVGVPLIAALGLHLLTAESVVEGTVSQSYYESRQDVEELVWSSKTSESKPTGSNIRNLTSSPKVRDVKEYKVVDKKMIDPPESCSYKDLENGFKEKVCVDPPPYEKEIKDWVVVGQEKYSVYSWEESDWEFSQSFTLGPIDADANKDDIPDIVDYPDAGDTPDLAKILRNSDRRLGSSSVIYTVVVTDKDGEQHYYSVDPNQAAVWDPGEGVKVTSSLLNGVEFEAH